MVNVGQRARLKVLRKIPHGLILDADGEDLLLPNRFVTEEMNVGDELLVFVHTDSEDRLIATTTMPLVEVGGYACLTVKTIGPLGAFLDWGLDKDLLLPFAEQPRRLQTEGERIVVRVLLDEKSGRPVATAKTEHSLEEPPPDLQSGDKVRMLPYQRTDLGVKVIVNQSFGGLLYLTEGEERHGTVQHGEPITGFVRRVREDGKVDLALARVGSAAADAARDRLLSALEEAGGTLSVGDQSSPEAIRSATGLSKKAFKRAAGALYKERRISLAPDALRLED